ncbi:MAG: hypothetical protein JW770_01930 [Actinobacteria bacterium]|nr:hypothetical protein [Actinomycetota bacterium]
MADIDIDDYIDEVTIGSGKIDPGWTVEDTANPPLDSQQDTADKKENENGLHRSVSPEDKKSASLENKKETGKNEETGHLKSSRKEDRGVINGVRDLIASDEGSPEYSLTGIRVHWLLVVIAALLAFFLSMANNVTINEALSRSLYAGAVFWILAEIIDYVFSIMR